MGQSKSLLHILLSFKYKNSYPLFMVLFNLSQHKNIYLTLYKMLYPHDPYNKLEIKMLKVVGQSNFARVIFSEIHSYIYIYIYIYIIHVQTAMS